jgi:hypothetical protein
MVAFLAALLLPGAVPAASTTAALVVASPIAGLALGIGVGWDREVPRRLAQRLQPAGFALLILPFATGLAAGPEPMGQAWISIASLAHALTGVTIGRRLSERHLRPAERSESPSCLGTHRPLGRLIFFRSPRPTAGARLRKSPNDHSPGRGAGYVPKFV